MKKTEADPWLSILFLRLYYNRGGRNCGLLCLGEKFWIAVTFKRKTIAILRQHRSVKPSGLSRS